MVLRRSGGPAGGGLIVWHDEAGFTLTASRPVELQIDGEGLGATTEVVFTSHPDALRVVGCCGPEVSGNASAFASIRLSDAQTG